jgi:TolB protein
VPAFYGATPEEARYAADIASVIRNNINNSTPFKLINPSAYLQTPAQIASQGVAFADWKGINSDALLTGTVTNEGGQLKIEFRLFENKL